MEESNHSENLYAYQDNESNKNEPPKESTAIRRSIGTGENPYKSNLSKNINNINNINIHNPSINIDQNQYFQQNNNNPSLSENNNNNFQAPNYDKSSEQRIPPLKLKSQQSNQINNVPSGNISNNNNYFRAYIVFILLLMLQIFSVVILGTAYRREDGDPNNFGKKDYLNSNYKDFGYYFHYLKDVHLMIFIGLGLLYCSLKDHQISSISLVLFIGIISLEFSLFWNYLWNNSFKKGHHKYDSNFSKIPIDIEEITQLDFFAATVIISLGAFIGKLSLGQYLLIILFETFFASFNYYLCYFAIGGIDTGGSLYVFTFGGIFGFIISFILAYDERYNDLIVRNQNNKSDYYSNIISAIGSLFIWLYFPSFNTARIHCDHNKNIMETMRYRGIINTYMSMFGSVVASFCTSSIIITERKFRIEHLLRSSYVGGVIIAGCCTFCPYPWCAILIGFVGGIISVLLSHWTSPQEGEPVFPLNPPSVNYLGNLVYALTNDTMGVMYCFGIPGILGGFFTSIFLGSLNEKPWKEGDGVKLENFFYYNRSASAQGGIQIAVLFITLGISLCSAILTGFVVKFIGFDGNENFFTDGMIFEGENNQFELPVFRSKNPLSSSENKLNSDEHEGEEGREVEINNNVIK